MGILRKKDISNQHQRLFLNIYVSRAADLVQTLNEADPQKYKKHLNPLVIARLNSSTKKTKKRLSTNNPTWDQTLSFELKPNDKSQIVTLCVWDRHRSYKNYLGELRINLNDIFTWENGVMAGSELKWYKLYSDEFHQAFVTGSLLLSFDLNTVSGIDSVKLEEHDHVQALFKGWIDSLIYNSSKTLIITDQGFYDDSGEISDILMSDIDSDNASHSSKGDDTKNYGPMKLLQKKWLQKNLLPNQGEYHSSSDIESVVSVSSVSSISDVYDTDSSLARETDNLDIKLAQKPSKSKRFTLKPPKPYKSRLKHINFEIRNRKVAGVLFLEIVSCTDLPPIRTLKNVGRFDMDPFVVVTFGKKTFRTSWKRHNLNPIFNERLAFEILSHERNFDVHFLVLDKDRFSLHDDVGSISIPLTDLIKNATAVPKALYMRPENQVSSEFTDTETDGHNNSNITYIENNNMVEFIEKKLIRKKKKVQFADTSKFKTMDLSLKLANKKYENKNTPKLKIRVRYETYENLRRYFWRRLLEQYSLNDSSEKVYDYIELISLLDTLGAMNSDTLVSAFFQKYGKLAWGGDTLTIEEISDCLETHILSNSNSDNKLFEIERCPNCLKKRLNNKSDMDVVTHFAICGSKHWSIVDKLLVSSYVTPQLATKRWFSKVLIKISYGKYQLGSNSANILVQDRTTGIILEEKMGIYIRLGIRLLYKGFDSANKRRIRALMKKLSIKQGNKFDSINLKPDIQSFIRFHKLDLSDCREPDALKYPTFNEFFYRRLKPGARPIEAENTPSIAVSPADCRCVAFDTVTLATELWIKGKNFTLPKLFNGNFDSLQDTNVYKSDNCTLGIFRLAPQDYHRFHSPVDGVIRNIKFIEGEYYTVNPMAIRSELDVYGENIRSIISIETSNFGTVIMIPVGAMMVGSTILTKSIGDSVKKGEEIGYFKFGGSTILLLFDKDKFQFDSDLINNSKSCIETLIRVGQSIGHTIDSKEYERTRVAFSTLTKSSKQNLIRVITGGDLVNSDELKTWESEKLKLSNDEINEFINDEFDEEDLYEGLEKDFDEEDEIDD